MRTAFLIFVLAVLMATSSTASAVTVNYNTTGSTLSCNGVAGCVQNTSTSVTIGGLTFTYNSGSGSGVATPSIINLGNIVSTGTGSNVNVAGLQLTINVNSTPPGASGTLPNGAISGTLSTNNSGATLLFSPNNTTTAFGTLPGVVISGGGQSFTYQILNPSLGLEAPTVGNPVGQTTIQGAVSSNGGSTTINYNTTGSTLSCNGVAGCVQNTATSVTIGGLTFTYNSGSGSGVATPSIINLGNIVSTGTGTNVNVAGLLLTINVNSTPPGASGTLPNGAISGTISTNSSAATILFSPNNTTTPFGTLPGVIISGGGQSFTYQILNSSLGLQAPTVGNPVGQTSIQGAVSANASIMTATVGTTPQSTVISTAFANALAVKVIDANSSPIAGVNVTFTAPGSGASGLFSNSTTTITVASNALGIASAPFTANGTLGPYTVTAAATGLTTVNFSLSNTSGIAALMTANAGTTPQVAAINTAFAKAPAVTVTDAGGTPIAGVNVTFTAPASGASGVFSNSTATITVATNATGVASAPFTANATAGGPYILSAAATALPTVNFSLTNSIPAATTVNYNTTGSTLSCNGVVGCVQNTSTSVTIGGLTFTYNAGSGSGVLTSSIINLGNIVSTGTGSNVNVAGLLLTINVNSTPPGASGTLPSGAVAGSASTNNSGATLLFSPNNTTTAFGTLPGVIISGGGQSFIYQILNPSLGLQAPTVGNPVGQTSIQGAVTFNGASTMTANAGTTPQSATVSTAFANALAVTVKDGGNNPLSGVNVTFTAPGSGASGVFSNSTATITVATNASGVASAPFTANATAGGPYVVTAAAASLASINFSLTNTTGAASTMTANAGTTPQSATVSTAFANALAVTVRDAGNNPVSGVNVTFTSPGAGASGLFSNSTATITVATNASGVAAAPLTANATAGGPYTVTAAATALAAVNFSLTNTAGAATHFMVSAPASATANSAFNVTVIARDAGNNAVAGYGGTVHFTSTDATAILPADAVLTNGNGTFSVTLKTAGTQTISATDTAAASVTGTSNAITVAAIAQTISNFSATPAAPIFVSGGTVGVSATGGASGNPVTFSIAGASAGICSAGGGNGATITMLAAGTCTVLADQAGNASYAAAAQATLAVAIGRIAATVALTSSANPSVFGSPITLTASVNTAAPAGASIQAAWTNVADAAISAAPGGSVIFSDGSTPLATVNLSNGMATYSTASLSVGSHAISAVYSGDATTAAASITITQVVNAAIPSVPAPMLSTWLLGLLGILFGCVALAWMRRT